MRNNFFTKIKTKISIPSLKKATSVLDGGYRSIFKGRSMEFEDLRDYVIGDDIKDIDWKASARSSQPLIRRYIAEKKHNVMIVGDVSNKMSGMAMNGEIKNQVALTVAGIISYIAHKNSDFMSLIMKDGNEIKTYPFKQTEMHIEKLLHDYNQAFNALNGETNIGAILDYLLYKMRKRMILFIITDSYGVSQISEEIFRKISLCHEQMYIIIKDANITEYPENTIYDLDAKRVMPKYISQNKKLAFAEAEYKRKLDDDIHREMRKRGVSSVTIGEEKEIVKALIKLLEGHKNGRIR